MSSTPESETNLIYLDPSLNRITFEDIQSSTSVKILDLSLNENWPKNAINTTETSETNINTPTLIPNTSAAHGENGITFKVADKSVENFRGETRAIENIIKYLDSYSHNTGGNIIQTSIKEGYQAQFDHGFIGAIFTAYNLHHKLALRPDDVWMAILTQFSLYVTNNAEELRYKFVLHSGKQRLVVQEFATLLTAHYDALARKIINIMEPFLIDDVRQWLIPNFSTTTLNDVTVASVVMMSAMQKYFSYGMELSCGIPEITLLGTPEDWSALRIRLDRLIQYDNTNKEMTIWYNLLVPILDEFVQSSQGNVNTEFWNKICHHISTGSGPSYLSGWITAFTVFDSKGVYQGKESSIVTWNGISIKNGKWPVIKTKDVTSGVVTVPVTINDNGTEYETNMFAGQLVYDVHNGNQLQPRSDWFIAIIDPKKIEANEW